ncbi:MAG: DUF427 domain-containing protein [Aureliella sp.]
MMWKFTGQQRPSFAEATHEGQESVWDYPRPPKCVPDEREIVVRLRETEIARTRRAVRVLETASPPTIYIPPDDVNREVLIVGANGSICEWKGRATYWSVRLKEQLLQNVSWSYEAPNHRFASIAGYYSFYPAAVECYVDEQRVRPQPGLFYGGWVTDEIVGPFKGAAGTGGW